MWYKNVRVYQLTKDIALVEELLQQKLAEFTFTPCHSQQPESLGWTSPILDEELLYHKQGQTIGLKLKIQQRILPSPVIREALEEKIKQKQADEGRRIFSREKRQLKDEIIEQLLPRSFTRSQYIKGFWDLKNNRLVIDVSSASKAEKFIKISSSVLKFLIILSYSVFTLLLFVPTPKASPITESSVTILINGTLFSCPTPITSPILISLIFTSPLSESLSTRFKTPIVKGFLQLGQIPL